MNTSHLINLVGREFGRWTVMHRGAKNTKAGAPKWFCKCVCGITRLISGPALRHGESTSCGCKRKETLTKRVGKSHQNWRGGKSIDTYGYVVISSGPLRGRKEHSLVMEKILGRPLMTRETVHHKNGVRNDNRPENLELWASRHPFGQRVSDLRKWAKEILATYPNEVL
jgi:hypothetical protein